MYRPSYGNESFNKSLEESLIKHADTIQYLRISWTPTTRILSYLANLLSLEINNEPYNTNWNDLNHLENLSLPILKILKARRVPFKILANLIENTKGHLSEISITYRKDCVDNKIPIKAIYQNCPNLRYLKISLKNNDNSFISAEFENLLINCQFLSELVIDTMYVHNNAFKWDKLFEILTKSSPISLFKFKFFSRLVIELEFLKSFFDNWKNRNPILLKIDSDFMIREAKPQLEDLTEKYKAKGIIKQYLIDTDINIYEDDFEWI